MTLTKGTIYNVETLRAIGWTAGDGTGHEGYNVSDYFAADGTYLGADECGIEPLFADTIAAPSMTPAIKAAMERIEGSLTDDRKSVIYYDDSTQRYYLAPVEDLDDLADYMASEDEDIARDAYSHWCAGTSHPECDREGNLA